MKNGIEIESEGYERDTFDVPNWLVLTLLFGVACYILGLFTFPLLSVVL